MSDYDAPMSTWTTVDAAEWSRAFQHHIALNPGLPTDWVAMVGWFSRAILAGMEYARREVEP